MKRKIFLLALLFNYQYLIIASIDRCSENFESIKKNSCEGLASNDSDQECSYTNNKCQQVYSSCGQYTGKTPETFNSNICSTLPTTGKEYICKAKGDSTGCEEVKRKCDEYNGEYSCEGLEAGENKHCVLSNNDKCVAHYKKCGTITVDEKDKCNNNLPLPSEYPSEKYSKCEWNSEGSTCDPVDRDCSEYKSFNYYLSKKGIACKDLKPKVVGNKCILEKGECKEGKADCGECKEEDANDCENYKPISSNNEVLSNFKCVYDETGKTCSKVQKLCSEYIEGEVDCGELLSPNDETQTKIICSLVNKKCVEKYLTCNAYNALDESKRDENECKAIEPLNVVELIETTTDSDHIKCIFDTQTKKCKEEIKKCTEMKDLSSCTAHTPILGISYKKCSFKNNKCIEQFTTCENYQDHEDEDKQNPDDCKAIKEGSLTEKCVFTAKNGDTKATCKTVQKKCSEFNLDTLKNYCTSYNTGLGFGQKCVYNNGACTTAQVKCSEISIDEDDGQQTNEYICNLATVQGSNKICTLNTDKKSCIEKEKEKESTKCECPSKEEDDNNSGNEKYLNKILIFILCLLI